MAYKEDRTAVNLPTPLMDEVKLLAKQEDRSATKMAEILLKEALSRRR